MPCRASSDAAEGAQPPDSDASAQPPDRELDTAYVQDMLATDPVVALGLRVVGVTPEALQYVSIDEAKQDLSARRPSVHAFVD